MSDLKRPADEQLQSPDNKIQKVETQINNTMGQFAAGLQGAIKAIESVAKKADIDSIISNLSLEHDKAVQDRDEQKRIQLEYNLRNAFDFKYAQLIANQSQKEISNQLRNDPNLRQAGANIDMQIAFVLDAMRSPGATVSKELKQVYLDRYKQLQDAQKEMLLLSAKIRESDSANLQDYYANQITDILGKVESQSVLKNPDIVKQFGDAVDSEQELVQQSLQRFNMIQSIFSPNSLSMADPRGQMLYSIVTDDQRRGRRPGEEPYDVSKLPLLVDTVKMAKEVFGDTSKDKRELFGMPYAQWTQEMKDAYASYMLKNYDNVVKQKGLELLSKNPEDMTADEIAEFSKYRDAYVIEKNYSHYLVTRDDPQWNDEDSKLFSRQIAQGGNEYYEPKPWEIGLSWGVAALGLAIGVAAFPLGLSTAAGTAAGLTSAAIGIGSIGMPPVGGPEWLHKLFMGLSITVAGTQLLYAGFTALPTRFQSALTPSYFKPAPVNALTGIGEDITTITTSSSSFLRAGSLADEGLLTPAQIKEFARRLPMETTTATPLRSGSSTVSSYTSAVSPSRWTSTLTPRVVTANPFDEIATTPLKSATQTAKLSERALSKLPVIQMAPIQEIAEQTTATMAKAIQGVDDTATQSVVTRLVSRFLDDVPATPIQTAEIGTQMTPMIGRTPIKEAAFGKYTVTIGGTELTADASEILARSPVRVTQTAASPVQNIHLKVIQRALEKNVIPGFLSKARPAITEAILGNRVVQTLPNILNFKESVVNTLVDTALGMAISKGASIEAISDSIALSQVMVTKYFVSVGMPQVSAEILSEIIPIAIAEMSAISIKQTSDFTQLTDRIGRALTTFFASDPRYATTVTKAALVGAGRAAVGVVKGAFKEFGRLVAESLLGTVRAETAQRVITSLINGVKANSPSFTTLASGLLVTSGSLGIGFGIEKGGEQTKLLMDELQTMFDMLQKAEPLIGKEGVASIENALVSQLISTITETQSNLFDNSINGFQDAFLQASGMTVQDVLKQYATGDKTMIDKFNAIVGTVMKALPEEFRNSSTKILVKNALEGLPTDTSSKEVVTTLAKQLYSKNTSNSEYISTSFISDLTSGVSKLIDNISVLYGDLPSSAVSDIQTSLLKEQFAYIQTESKKIASNGYSLNIPETVMREIARESYKEKAATQIGGTDLIYESDTIKAYKDPNSNKIILGFRGTADTRDVKAWVPTGMGQLSKTERYDYDKKQLVKLFSQFSPEKYVYYAVGHSLGGALSTQFKRDFSFIKNAVTYNSAVSPQDYLSKNDASIIRRYTENDVLFNLQGGKLVGGEVIGDKKQFDTGNYTLDTILGLWDMVQGHKMDNFFVDERRDAGYSY